MMRNWGDGVHWWSWLFGSHGRSPDDILARCVSLGEIDDEEHKRRLAVLRGSVRGPAGLLPAGPSPLGPASLPPDPSQARSAAQASSPMRSLQHALVGS